MIRPPHRRLDRESVMLLGRHPRTIEAIEFYEDVPGGSRFHCTVETSSALSGLIFETQEDRNCVRELLLRIEDLEADKTWSSLRRLCEDHMLENPAGSGIIQIPFMDLFLILELVDTIRLKGGHEQKGSQ